MNNFLYDNFDFENSFFMYKDDELDDEFDEFYDDEYSDDFDDYDDISYEEFEDDSDSDDREVSYEDEFYESDEDYAYGYDEDDYVYNEEWYNLEALDSYYNTKIRIDNKQSIIDEIIYAFECFLTRKLILKQIYLMTLLYTSFLYFVFAVIYLVFLD